MLTASAGVTEHCETVSQLAIGLPSDRVIELCYRIKTDVALGRQQLDAVRSSDIQFAHSSGGF